MIVVINTDKSVNQLNKVDLSELNQISGFDTYEDIPCLAYVNKIGSQEFNVLATKLWQEQFPYSKYGLYGTVVIVTTEKTNAIV